jgi:hypothetical protein
MLFNYLVPLKLKQFSLHISKGLNFNYLFLLIAWFQFINFHFVIYNFLIQYLEDLLDLQVSYLFLFSLFFLIIRFKLILPFFISVLKVENFRNSNIQFSFDYFEINFFQSKHLYLILISPFMKPRYLIIILIIKFDLNNYQFIFVKSL